MKLHRNLLEAIVTGVAEVLLYQKQADRVVEFLLGTNKKWGARDRHFVADNLYSIIRYKRLYEFCVRLTTPLDIVSIRKVLGVKLLLDGFDVSIIDEWKQMNREEISALYQEAQSIRSIRESIPDWLDKLGRAELGKQWDVELAALNENAPLSIRVNTLKTNRDTMMRIFDADQIEYDKNPNAPDALTLKTRKNLRSYPAYQNGLFEIQDVSSQLVAPMLDAKPGMLVIDGCAGAGGKALHLAALMQNQGQILAVDINDTKLEQLQLRANRAGCTIIQSMNVNAFMPEKSNQLHSTADRILLDVPCSGLGVLRRKPDAKWQLSLDSIQELIKTQAILLTKYAPLLKPGGCLVYSTCSILPSENQNQIRDFISSQKENFELAEEKIISPAQSGFDGFYIAKLRKLS